MGPPELLLKKLKCGTCTKQTIKKAILALLEDLLQEMLRTKQGWQEIVTTKVSLTEIRNQGRGELENDTDETGERTTQCSTWKGSPMELAGKEEWKSF